MKRYNLNMITQIKDTLFVLMILVTILMTSCSDKGMMNTTLVNRIIVQDVRGNLMDRSIQQMGEEVSKASRAFISVIYTGNLDEILLDESSSLYKAIKTYHLNLEEPFEINETMKGIKLSSPIEMEDPISIGKQISIGKSILMVEVKQVSNNEI